MGVFRRHLYSLLILEFSGTAAFEKPRGFTFQAQNESAVQRELLRALTEIVEIRL